MPVGVDDVKEVSRELLGELGRVVVGYEEEKALVLASLIAGGHVLLEGVPGIAKTTLAKSLARLLGLSEGYALELDGVAYRGFSRVQFTPDLMPSDITGNLVFNPSTRSFEPRFGPVFTYFLLADEINRAVPRTQSALLQAMQEREVTIGDRSYRLEVRERGKFFFVIATQNPVEQEGTYPLPEAQLDRFLMRVFVGYPSSLEEEVSIYRLHGYRVGEPYEDLERLVEPGWVVEAQDCVARSVEVPDEVFEYVARVVRLTRPSVYPEIAEYFELGASPRSGIALVKASKALAAMRGSTVVERVDVDRALFPVLNHRLVLNVEKLVSEEFRGEKAVAHIKVIREGLRKVVEVARG
ncbi:AAA family ATPase [Thermofilum pendens]|uniref:ATPase associated with various cellular activities, AAA_3 n=1 Tax=Thermofilum pendens (strain DSM 2475 / Hrk 5) TaxID=368408 RepID=A1S115_THEPD|nr:AAA family ATPase [Thermofilum pendens]ABL79145.1 ATPase associated with various cellular activities, AAA_3 [Thermofilum pendens Hrk 5]